MPNVFTEHGALMAANVLKSSHAVQMSVFVIRAFVRLRHVVTTHKELAAKLVELERTVASHDGDIRTPSTLSANLWNRLLRRNPAESDSRLEVSNRLLTVVSTILRMRDEKETIRIISARQASRKER